MVDRKMPETMTTTAPEEEKKAVQETTNQEAQLNTSPEAQAQQKSQEAAQQAIEAKTAKTTQETAQEAAHFQTQLELQNTQKHILESLLETQIKMQEVQERINRLSEGMQVKEGEISLSAQQMGEMQALEDLLSKVKIGLQAQDLRQLMIQSPDFLDNFIDQVKKDTKLEKKRRDKLEKLAKEMKKNLEAKQENNYYFQTILSFSQLNNDLKTGDYLNSQFAVLKRNPLFVDIYKHRKSLAEKGMIQLNIDGKTINVYDETKIQAIGNGAHQLINYNKPQNILEKFISENTKMSVGQARSMIGLGGTIAAGFGVFYLGKWLFTGNGDKDSTLLGRAAKLIGIPLGLHRASQMGTGEGILTHLQRAWKEGVWPRDKLLESSDPMENMTLEQNTGHFALLGVPYGVLQECVKFNNGIATEIEANKLLEYYKNALQDAEKRKDTAAVTKIGMQIKSVESILANEKAKLLLNQSLAKLGIQEGDVKNPANAMLNLDEKLYEQSQRTKELDLYLQRNNLRIDPKKFSELQTKLFGSEKALTESDFNTLLKEDFFLPNTPLYLELSKLSTLPESEKKSIYQSYEKLSKIANYENIKLDILTNGKIKISSNGKESMIDPVARTLEGFKNAAEEVRFESQEDLMRTALLVNSIRMKSNVWGDVPDTLKKTDENYPFDIGNLATKSIYFKKHGGEEVVIMSDLLPVVSEMDRNFSTIEKEENRKFFVKYLNQLWNKDPESNKGDS